MEKTRHMSDWIKQTDSERESKREGESERSGLLKEQQNEASGKTQCNGLEGKIIQVQIKVLWAVPEPNTSCHDSYTEVWETKRLK